MKPALSVALKQLPHGADLPLPSYGTAGSAGMDLLAAITAPVTLAPGARALVPTGITLALPVGYEAQVRPRSGLALKQGLTILNTPGTIDADYRGEVGVILINLGQSPVTLQRGDRIAQMIIEAIITPEPVFVDELEDTARGDNGFGSTGN